MYSQKMAPPIFVGVVNPPTASGSPSFDKEGFFGPFVRGKLCSGGGIPTTRECPYLQPCLQPTKLVIIRHSFRLKFRFRYGNIVMPSKFNT